MELKIFLITYGDVEPLKQIEIKATCHVWAAMKASKIILGRNKYSKYDFKVLRITGQPDLDGTFQTKKDFGISDILINEFYVEQVS